jgi:ribose transport system substrate-binding protein
VQTWIAQKVDAMTILALDINAMAPFVKQAHDAGIPFVSYAQSVPGSDGYVTFDDASAAPQVGTMAADWINTKLGGTAKVAFMGDYTIENNVIRLNPAKEALLKAAPKAQVVYEGKGLLAPEALATTQTLLQQHPDLKVVIAAADDGALGASQAFTTSGKNVSDVWIAGYDGSEPAMEKAITGTDPLRLVAALPLYTIGQMVVTVPDNVIKKSGETNYKAPYTMVSAANKAEGEKLINDFKAHTG